MKKPHDGVLVRNVFFTSILAALLAGCSGSQSRAPEVSLPNLPLGPEIPAGSIPLGQERFLQGPLQSTLRVMNSGDHYYLEIESVISPEEFGKLHGVATGGVGIALEETKRALKEIGAIPTAQNAETGYLKFWLPYRREMLSALKTARLSHALYFSPSHYDFTSLKEAKSFTAESLGFNVRTSASNPSTDAYSGLATIHAPDFVKITEATIGTPVNGSSARLGITDTGITLRHPTFTDSGGKASRVVYVKDFTREGRIYFNPSATFSATAGESPTDFVVSAQFLETLTLPVLPTPSDFKELKNVKLKASAALAEDLRNTKLKPYLGYLNESVFQGAESQVDLNANGKLDDRIPLILFIDAEHPELSHVYANFAGQAKPDALLDFSKSVPLADFNRSRATVDVFAERVGFTLKGDQLTPPGSDTAVPVYSASLVGFDPGNHGTHVAGIAAGRKTISNDVDTTLARGVAPAAQIFMNRVCANTGGCNATEAIIDLALTAKVDVINMSLGSLSPFNDGYGVQETLINRLTSIANVLFVVSAGNSGPGRQTVGSPSVARKAISVAATATRAMIERQYQWPGQGAATSSNNDDFVLYFSSRGPTAAGGMRPNLSAPGTELSSIQLNSAPGSHAGLDVYWGTSMAAPVVTGAYALFLDAVRKYNTKFPKAPLPSDSETLRSVLLSSGRRFAPEQYTWIDEGSGMVDLVAAWKKLLVTARDRVPSGVADSEGRTINLDYQVLTSQVMANGLPYDGSRPVQTGPDTVTPAFGTGIYFDSRDGTQLKKAYISRTLPEKLAAGPEGGELTVQLETSAEEFVLRTDFGRDEAWAKAGVRSELDCLQSEMSNVRILGRGAEVVRDETGRGQIDNYSGSDLNICLDRAKLALLPPGDHGALVYGYRTVSGQVSTLPSFVVPIYLTVPHQTLLGNTAYEVSGKVRGFQVARNYVLIPPATSMVRITLEVPENKPGVKCSSVLLQMLEGGNTKLPKESAALLRATNCSGQGAPSSKQRKVVLTRTNPQAGVWDIHLLGIYNVAESEYRLRVDYAVGEASLASIEGDESALTGSFDWKIKEASFALAPSPEKSTYELNALYHRENSKVTQDEQVIVGGPLGLLRKYDPSVKKVVIATGGAPGNDIDLEVLACPEKTTDIKDLSACQAVAESGGATDVERAEFEPEAGMAYAVRVSGYAIRDGGEFFCDESQVVSAELGTLAIKGASPNFTIAYGFSPEAIANSILLKSPLYLSKDYAVRGAITLRTDEGVPLVAVPVLIRHP